ncbi:hypothetical protein NCG91_04285 [Janthinobacterium sp. GK]|uniref:Uncharacterized protein n=1 Tax=Janthinobacterium kumbetense TaxID=2950280 RepID=A0ABT0WL65_9BURK|nr:hypothetical protein [Janthinobacterium kumbetense]MCM2564806.1 hypothetical protein [Janthinobacterium kumbetense]
MMAGKRLECDLRRAQHVCTKRHPPYIDFRHHNAPGAEVAFLVKRPALHFLAAVLRYVAGDLVRPGHSKAETVRVADLAHLFAVRTASQDALPDGAQQRVHLPSSDGHMKMQGATSLFFNVRYIMKLFMLTKLSDKKEFVPLLLP